MKEQIIRLFITTILNLIGKLPFSILYFIADFLLFPLLFYVFAYRRKVVVENLTNSFPTYAFPKIKSIEKAYFHYLTELMVETVKGFQISDNELVSRMEWDRSRGVNPFENLGNLVFTFGHYGNYEWLNLAISAQQNLQLLIPYRTVSSKSINDFLKQKREKFGSFLFPAEATSNVILQTKTSEKKYAFFLANDQSAPVFNSYSTTFLNQPTHFFRGSEKIAGMLKLPVVFIAIERKKRGYYTYFFELISENAANEHKGFCLEKHAKLLEKQIINESIPWLWSHRRWKYKS